MNLQLPNGVFNRATFYFCSTLAIIFFSWNAVAENPPRPSYRQRSVAADGTPTTVVTPANSNTVVAYPPPNPPIPPQPHEKVDDFNPYDQLYSIGIEGPAVPTTSVFKDSAVMLGIWTSRQLGFEGYIGYTKSVDTFNTATSTVTANSSTPVGSTATTVYSGQTNPNQFILGGAIKYRVYQAKYFGVSADFLLTLTPGTSVSYQTGTQATTTPDITNPGNQTVTQTNYGTVTSNVGAFLRVGPRMTVDYHLPFVPNLVLGAAVGVYISAGGQSTTTTTTTNQNYAVVNGVNQPRVRKLPRPQAQ